MACRCVFGSPGSTSLPPCRASWHQTVTGDWWARVQIEVTNRRERDRMVLVQLVPANAVQPREQKYAATSRRTLDDPCLGRSGLNNGLVRRAGGGWPGPCGVPA